MELTGVMTALVTPFDKELDVDQTALDTHVQFQIEQGVKVLVIGGTIGESAALSRRERQEIARRVVTSAAGRASVLVGTGSDRSTVTSSIARHAEEVGASGLLAALPAHFKLTESEQFAYWTWFSGQSTLPWILYSAVTVSTPRPSLELLEKLLSLPGFVGYKEPRSDLAFLGKAISHFGTSLPIIAASEIILPQAIMAGAVGAMTATACFSPATVAAIIDGVQARDLQKVQTAYSRLMEFRSCFQDRMEQGYPSYLPYTKATCEILGLPSGPPRPPLFPVRGEDRTRLEDIIIPLFSRHATEA